MSSDSRPIDPLRFAEALETLPLDALHAKAAELSNSISQLRSSNLQMSPFADEGDADCKEAMFENLGVITRMHNRVELIKAEVEKRGMPWPSEERERGVVDASLVNNSHQADHELFPWTLLRENQPRRLPSNILYVTQREITNAIII
jgi:hypothetical protein